MAEFMRAAFYERQGPAHEVLQVASIERPKPGPGEVLVKVATSGVNPADTYARQGLRAQMPFARVVPNQDGAGVIEAVGQGVPQSRVGERVWVYESAWNRPHGTAAEYTTVPSVHTVQLPDTVDFDAGACLGIPALTAHRALFVDGPVTGKTVLVTGGAGAVGSTAVQLAKWGGARVIATISSDSKAQEAREAGADHVINYRTEDVVTEVKRVTDGEGVDRIIEVDFGGNLSTSLQILKLEGVIAGYASRGDAEPKVSFRALMQKNLTVRIVFAYTMPESAKAAAAADVTRALEEGALKPRIGARMPLDQVADAHEAVEQGSVIGNIVLMVTDAK
jgi:NADPH2:quinone reductase